MSRPLHRGISGVKIPDSNHDLRVSQSKDKADKEDFDRRASSDHSSQSPLALSLPLRLFFSDNSPSKYGNSENGFTDSFIAGSPRSRFRLTMLLLKSSLLFIVVLALMGSFWWTILISSSSRGHIYHGYRRLQEKLVLDLLDIGEFSSGTSKFKEMEFCSQEFENFVPCYNVSKNLALGYSDSSDLDRHCEHEVKQNCLILPPAKYKIPLRWPTGRDVIWAANVKITAQEVLSSGSLTKRWVGTYPYCCSTFGHFYPNATFPFTWL